MALLLLTGCSVGTDGPVPDGGTRNDARLPEVGRCDNRFDDDRDGLSDCADPDCRTDPACQERCGNRIDDDLDGDVDCVDKECIHMDRCAGREGECDNGVDDDGDGSTDCADSDCTDVSACEGEFDCKNGVDGDDDGLTDCDDPDCSGTRACGGEDCKNNRDDDGDGMIDCADADCAETQDCATREDCINLKDDDGDGLVDCSDPECESAGACVSVEDCANGRDDDGDGSADCADDDCDGSASCGGVENCSDGVDDDGDGEIDCNDSDCTSVCVAEDCSDGIDNDEDEATDCEDTECESDVVCAPSEDCSDGLDNDRDGDTDCADDDCDALDACTCADRTGSGTPFTDAGDTTGAGDDTTPSCASSSAPDVAIEWTAPSTGSYTFSTAGSGFDTVLYVLDGATCGGREIACDDDGGPDLESETTVMLDRGQTVTVIVDGYSESSGFFQLEIAGASTAEDCSDGSDNDGDGSVDCDDDDCGDECEFRCVNSTLLASPQITYEGSTWGTDDLSPDCRSSSAAPEAALKWTAPVSSEYEFSTEGSSFDTVLYAIRNDCTGEQIACNDDAVGLQSEISVSLSAGETVILVVDGYGSASGDYRLVGAPIIRMTVHSSQSLLDRNGRAPEQMAVTFLRHAFDDAGYRHEVVRGFPSKHPPPEESSRCDGDSTYSWWRTQVNDGTVETRKDANLLLLNSGNSGCGAVGGWVAVAGGAHVDETRSWRESGSGKWHRAMMVTLHETAHNLGVRHNSGDAWTETVSSTERWHRTPMGGRADGADNRCGEPRDEKTTRLEVFHHSYHDCALSQFDIRR